MQDIGIHALIRHHAGWVEARQAVVARNIAQIDTHGIQAIKVEPFSKLMAHSGARSLTSMSTTHAQHIVGNGSIGSVAIEKLEGAPVLEREMIALSQTRQAHELNIAIAGAFHRMQIAAVRS